MLKKSGISFISLIALGVLMVGCGGGGGGGNEPVTPAVTTWEKLVWDDGSNNPNSRWAN